MDVVIDTPWHIRLVRDPAEPVGSNGRAAGAARVADAIHLRVRQLVRRGARRDITLANVPRVVPRGVPRVALRDVAWRCIASHCIVESARRASLRCVALYRRLASVFESASSIVARDWNERLARGV